MTTADQSAVVWTDWFGTAPWFMAGVIVTIAVYEVIARRRIKRAASYAEWLRALRSVTSKSDNGSAGGAHE